MYLKSTNVVKYVYEAARRHSATDWSSDAKGPRTVHTLHSSAERRREKNRYASSRLLSFCVYERNNARAHWGLVVEFAAPWCVYNGRRDYLNTTTYHYRILYGSALHGLPPVNRTGYFLDFFPLFRRIAGPIRLSYSGHLSSYWSIFFRSD